MAVRVKCLYHVLRISTMFEKVLTCRSFCTLVIDLKVYPISSKRVTFPPSCHLVLLTPFFTLVKWFKFSMIFLWRTQLRLSYFYLTHWKGVDSNPYVTSTTRVRPLSIFLSYISSNFRFVGSSVNMSFLWLHTLFLFPIVNLIIYSHD